MIWSAYLSRVPARFATIPFLSFVSPSDRSGTAAAVPATRASGFVPSVQGLRGVSAMAVVGAHLDAMALHGGFAPYSGTILEAALQTLGHGVDLFFIISGFVIPGSLFRHRDVRRFFLDRLLRIMPLFLTLQVLICVIGRFIGYKWLKGIGPSAFAKLFLANATFIAFPLDMPLLQQNSWSLTYEWGFYIFVAAAWYLLVQRQLRRLGTWLFAAAALAIGVTHPVCIYFLIGLAFARVQPSLAVPPLAEAVLLPVCLISFLYTAEFVSRYVAALPACVLFAFVLDRRSLTSRFLESRPLLYLGEISYSLYLVHPLAIFPVRAAAVHATATGHSKLLAFTAYLIIALPLVLVASIASHRWLEVGWRSLIMRLVRGPGHRQATPPSQNNSAQLAGSTAGGTSAPG
jgi:peptidoglycan/LPS O-acetylase OafA/YrhL